MNLFKKIENIDEKSDFTTYPRTFEGYRWYKPILIGISAFIIYIILITITIMALLNSNPMIFTQVALNKSSVFDFSNPIAIIGSLSVILIIPSIYIPSKLFRERPFSSYLSSKGGWDWNIFIKSLVITLIVFAIFSIIQIVIMGNPLNNKFTILTFLLCIIFTSFQCFSEEYLFRAFIMQTFGSWFKIPIIAIIIQAILFVLMHGYNQLGLIVIFIIGLSFGLITWYTKGLEVSSVMHAVSDISSFLLNGLGFTTATLEIGILDFVTSIAPILITLFLILYIDKKYNWFGFNENKDVDLSN